VGDRAPIGKSPGTDLKEGVFTAPVLIAAERDVGFAERLSDGSRDVDDVMPVLRSTGALDDTMTMAARYGRAAIADIDGLPETDWSRSLEQMIHTVIAQVPSAPKL
jgi:geranylgeranyl pyrophosphate synthase